jgi:carboxyl-terminal processing protease
VALFDPAYRFTFDQIGALPEACTRPEDASPMAVIDAIGGIFAAHYAFFKARHVDWPALVAAAKSKVGAETSQEELLQIANELLQNLDDDHVTLVAQINGETIECNMGGAAVLRRISGKTCATTAEQDDVIERWKQSVWTDEIEDALLDDTARTRANRNITYGLIDGEVGFLSLLSMEDFDASNDDDAAVLDAALDEAMALFEDARAVIVDVSLNDGGEDVLARRIAARFAAKRTLAYSKYAGDTSAARPQEIFIEPGDGPRYTGPVYLMTSNVTVSAAEIFTFVMRALPNVTHVGQTTRGALSDVLTKRLPNGWRVTLSNEVYLDAAGKAWEGRGIPPKVEIPVFTPSGDAAMTHVQALRAVVDGIR